MLLMHCNLEIVFNKLFHVPPSKGVMDVQRRSENFKQKNNLGVCLGSGPPID